MCWQRSWLGYYRFALLRTQFPLSSGNHRNLPTLHPGWLLFQRRWAFIPVLLLSMHEHSKWLYISLLMTVCCQCCRWA